MKSYQAFIKLNDSNDNIDENSDYLNSEPEEEKDDMRAYY